MELDTLEKYAGGNNREELNKIVNSYQKKLDNEKDPFKYARIHNKMLHQSIYKINGVKYEDYFIELNKFLNQLKKLKNKCILIVSHGAVMYFFKHLITNTENTVKFIPYNSKEITGGNCNIMMCLLKDNKFKLVMPRNSNHLINITGKN